MTTTIDRADWTLAKLDVTPAKFSKRHPLSFRKQAIYVGDHPYEPAPEGVFSVNESMIDDWVSTGRAMLKEGIKIPLPISHSEKAEDTRGWITGFEKKTDEQGRVSLYLSGKARDEETKDLLKANDISIYSPVSRKIKGRTWHRPITHACITSYPIITGLGEFELVCDYGGMMYNNADAQNQQNIQPNTMQFNPNCPACQNNKKIHEQGDGMNYGRPVRRLFAFSETHEAIDEAVREIREESGCNVVFIGREKGQTLVCSSAARTEDDEIFAQLTG